MQSAYDVTRPNGSGRRVRGDRVTFIFRLYRRNLPPQFVPIAAPDTFLGSIQKGIQSARRAVQTFAQSTTLPQFGPHVGYTLEKEYRFVMIVEEFAVQPETRSRFQYTQGGFFVDMPFKNGKGKTTFRIRGRANWTPVFVDGVLVDGDAAIKEFSEMIGDYFFPVDGTRSVDHELYFYDLLAPISAEDPFGEFEWLIQPTAGVRQSMRHDKPWQRFYEFGFDGLQSNRDFARSEDGFLLSLFSTGPLAALLDALDLKGLADGITTIFGIVNDFNGLVEDVTNVVQTVNDYLRGVVQFIDLSFAAVRSILTRVDQLIGTIDQGIEIAKELPTVFSDQWDLLQQTWQGFTTLVDDVVNQKGLDNGMLTRAEACKVRDLLLALAAQPQNFQTPLDIPDAAGTVALRIAPNATLEALAADAGVDPRTLIAANNLRFPFVDARLRPEAQRQAALDRVGTESAPGPLLRQLAEITSDTTRVLDAVTAAYTNEPPPHTAQHAVWQAGVERALRTQAAWQAEKAKVEAQIAAAQDEAAQWGALMTTGNPINPRFNEHVSQPGVLYAGDTIRIPKPRPDLVPSIIGIDGNALLNTGVAATDEERLFGIDLLLGVDRNLQWDLDHRDLMLVRGLENIQQVQVHYVMLPLGQLRSAPGIGNYAWRDLARWQNEATNRLLAYALYRTISQDPRIAAIAELRAATYEGVAHLVYRATLINGMTVRDLRTPLNIGAGLNG